MYRVQSNENAASARADVDEAKRSEDDPGTGDRGTTGSGQQSDIMQPNKSEILLTLLGSTTEFSLADRRRGELRIALPRLSDACARLRTPECAPVARLSIQ